MTFADVVHSVLVRKSAKLLCLSDCYFTWSSSPGVVNLANGECAALATPLLIVAAVGNVWESRFNQRGPWPLGLLLNEFRHWSASGTPITTTYLSVRDDGDVTSSVVTVSPGYTLAVVIYAASSHVAK